MILTWRVSQTAAGENFGRNSTQAPDACAVCSATTAPCIWCSGSACSSLHSHQGTVSLLVSILMMLMNSGKIPDCSAAALAAALWVPLQWPASMYVQHRHSFMCTH